jgi:hypothetical protein
MLAFQNHSNLSHFSILQPERRERRHTKTKAIKTMTMMPPVTAPTLFRPRRHRECYASVNLHDEWRSCYLKAMGLEEEDWVDDSGKETAATTTASRPDMILTNLLPHNNDNNNNEDMEDSKEADSVPDPWTLTARSMQTSIFEMAAWIDTKKWDYVSVYMSDDEASLIQSTVTSFIATTANEIEGLRHSLQLLSDANNTASTSTNTTTRHQHRTGIVQILLTLLQLEIAQPFRVWQKQRQRAAVQLWQNPYSCTLVTAAQQQQQHAAARKSRRPMIKSWTLPWAWMMMAAWTTMPILQRNNGSYPDEQVTSYNTTFWLRIFQTRIIWTMMRILCNCNDPSLC